MNSTGTVIRAALLLVPFILFGCSHNTMSRHWGSSYQSAIESQTAYPDAAQNTEPVAGFDGQAAHEAMKSYQQGSEKQKKDTTYNLRLGNIEGIGKKRK